MTLKVKRGNKVVLSAKTTSTHLSFCKIKYDNSNVIIKICMNFKNVSICSLFFNFKHINSIIKGFNKSLRLHPT